MKPITPDCGFLQVYSTQLILVWYFHKHHTFLSPRRFWSVYLHPQTVIIEFCWYTFAKFSWILVNSIVEFTIYFQVKWMSSTFVWAVVRIWRDNVMSRKIAGIILMFYQYIRWFHLCNIIKTVVNWKDVVYWITYCCGKKIFKPTSCYP